MTQRRLFSVEPAYEVKQAASMIAQLYVALVQEGFTEEQALEIVKNKIG